MCIYIYIYIYIYIRLPEPLNENSLNEGCCHD